ncbi:hypothetical protein Cylst_5867 [Cylindrospermum stagnale PCC 7417]|uniref:Uncharacterized protein n=1 Tax=Cylindrospermum stagnale PCC 7417 TaxID=56107 RepID=K9X6Z6_9NOST|nr:hypothetical protein [Cylindrospermum stagnale]AFZ27851.1 hypothetical protein Cylst_5867 [Cylindrospermum stagnale PCC 7417]
MRDDRPPGKKGKFALNSAAKIVLFTTFSGMFLTSSFYLASLIISGVNTSLSNIHPTFIPWISDEDRCESSGRSWRDNKCWDYEHSPSF